MDYINVVGNRLETNSFSKHFRGDIFMAKRIGEYIVVAVDETDDDERWNNIWAYDLNGNLVWRIQDKELFDGKINKVPYVGFRQISDSEIVVTNFSGLSYRVSLVDGKIVGGAESTK